MIKWPGSVHNTNSKSKFNTMLREGVMPDCSKIIVEEEPVVPICVLRDPIYPLLPYIMKEFASDGKNEEEQFFWLLTFISWNVFGTLKARFGCVISDMDINLDDLTNATHSCFIIQNFCEIHRRLINPQYVTAALKYDSDMSIR